ncbi:hypothetical protein D932_02062 [Enterococcus casseliflavus 14-MB-W-14]|nr:hypothetical protein D932_02062 [Enterococcus casseliflavus 14-MB-W-14]
MPSLHSFPFLTWLYSFYHTTETPFFATSNELLSENIRCGTKHPLSEKFAFAFLNLLRAFFQSVAKQAPFFSWIK